MRRALILAMLLGLGCTPKQPLEAQRPPKHSEVPSRPELLTFEEQQFVPPLATDHRHELSSGVPVFVASSDDLPLVTLTFTFMGGRYVEPDDKTGLAEITLQLLREGGTTQRSPEALDEAFALLAANVSASAGPTTSRIRLDVPKQSFDEALALVVEMTRQPAFDRKRLDLAVSTAIEGMKARNDDAGSIAAREFDRLMYGEDHLRAAVPTQPELASIRQADLRAFHSKVVQPGNLVVAASGDITPEELLPKLEEAFAGWEARPRLTPPEEPVHQPEPGLYHVQKDIPQGKVRIGLRAIQRDDPDYFPLLVMNDILGGGGFTSRIMARVRSDEGLAYGARSSLDVPVWWPGTLSAWFDSKNATVALATRIVVDEIARIRTEPVSDDELTDAKRALAANLPRAFGSKESMLSYFVDDELTGRDPGYWQSWQQQVEAVSADDVLRVAQEHLDPDQLVILVVGDWEPIAQGDVTGRARMTDFGTVRHLPLRDPLTQRPL